jgi:hypothetical protein
MDMSVSGDGQARLREYVYLLSTSVSLDSGFALLNSHITGLGFDAIAYSALPAGIGVHGAFKPVFLTSSDYSKEFLAHYDEDNLWRQDFTIERIQNGLLDCMDWQLESHQKRVSVEQQELIDLAVYEYGMKNALTIPTQADEDVIAGASVLSYSNRLAFEKLKHSYYVEVLELVRHFHQFVFMRSSTSAFFYKPIIDSLTDSQKLVLKFVVKGRLQKHSKEFIGLSPTRTGNVLSELYERLNVANASELSFVAGKHRLTDMIEL